ncbi:hypothetical protein [Streptomyces parvulus]|uniref:hypothetical protein n=1 Tax=Streptomyces parvulus TaxID=146923 RepID=UPI00210DB8D3|nr:hypothetical protein [Streptomyces parvulus]MCQ4193863.1 hypothetical protein [Streptomyces parvulus]
MPRKPYTMSEAALAVRRANASKGAAARNSLDGYIKQIVDRAPELTDAQIARLRPLLARVSGGASE